MPTDARALISIERGAKETERPFTRNLCAPLRALARARAGHPDRTRCCVSPRAIRGIMHILMITKRNTDNGARVRLGTSAPMNGARRPTLPQSAPHKLQSRHVLSSGASSRCTPWKQTIAWIKCSTMDWHAVQGVPGILRYRGPPPPRLARQGKSRSESERGIMGRLRRRGAYGRGWGRGGEGNP